MSPRVPPTPQPAHLWSPPFHNPASEANHPISLTEQFVHATVRLMACSERAFEASPLGVRLAALTDIADGLNRRRNILVHGRMLETTEGGFVTLVEKPALGTVYSVGLDDLIKLDDDLTRA